MLAVPRLSFTVTPSHLFPGVPSPPLTGQRRAKGLPNLGSLQKLSWDKTTKLQNKTHCNHWAVDELDWRV